MLEGSPITTNPAAGQRQPRSLAAEWISARAAQLFGACEALLRAEARKSDTFAPSPIELIWAGMSDAERDDFVHSHRLEVWDSVDRITR